MISKVLLVQKDELCRKAVAECLRENDFQVYEVSNGEHAIWKLFHERMHIDLMIYDFGLPQEDRVKAAVALRASHRVIPIIVLTDSPSITADRALFRGTVEFLEKPISNAELLSMASRLVARLCRRKRDNQTWHVCTNCKDWPISDYEEQQLSPTVELELCNECRLNMQQGICF
jgi:DNA-binding response OmpR family regulator